MKTLITLMAATLMLSACGETLDNWQPDPALIAAGAALLAPPPQPMPMGGTATIIGTNGQRLTVFY